MDLHDALCVSYPLRVESAQDGTGRWLRTASYPAFEGCAAAGVDLAAVVQEVEIARIRRIVALVVAGEELPPGSAVLRSHATLLGPAELDELLDEAGVDTERAGGHR